MLQRRAGEVGLAEIDGSALRDAELPVADGQLEIAKLGFGARIFAPPGIPGPDAFLQFTDVLRPRHRSSSFAGPSRCRKGPTPQQKLDTPQDKTLPRPRRQARGCLPDLLRTHSVRNRTDIRQFTDHNNAPARRGWLRPHRSPVRCRNPSGALRYW